MSNPAAGFFGKLPSAGDFVQRRLPASFVDAWDQHFEGAVAQSRAVMVGDWHEAYQASPVWRFLLSPRVCGDAAWLGVMGPGTDRVGRCFPMVIANALPADSHSCRQALLHGDHWCDAAERIHDTTQSDGAVSVEAFDELVASLPDPLNAMPASGLELDGIDGNASGHWRLPLVEGGGTGARLERCWQQLAANAGPWCLWWTRGRGRVPPTLLITRGLPHADAYAGFLDAGQAVSSWRSVGEFGSTPAPSVAFAPTPSHPPTIALMAAEPASERPAPPVTAWLPDDLDLLDGLGTSAPEPTREGTSMPEQQPGPVAVAAGEMLDRPSTSVGVLQRPELALTLVAAQLGKLDPRQQAIAEVMAIGQQLAPEAADPGLPSICARLLAVSPRLHAASEDLIDPVPEDCAVIAAQVNGNHVHLLKIGAASAWHWRNGRLQPLFATASTSASTSSVGADDDFNALLFSQETVSSPGLGATDCPECAELQCEVVAADRLLLVATEPLTRLSHEVLVGSLGLPSCDEARQAVAHAAGLGADPAQWPFAIIEIDA